jgi:ferrous iron transport protein B
VSPSILKTYRPPKVVIVGNPNSGKTTLFNALTGLNYKVANYPGVTVESREAEVSLYDDLKIRLIDLPGLYSFSSLSLDEQIASNEILAIKSSESCSHSIPPDLALCVVDASNLERNLYLASQMIDSGLKVIIVLTIADLAEDLGIKVKNEILARLLDATVVNVQAQKRTGLDLLKQEIRNKLRSDFVQSIKAFDWMVDQKAFIQAAQSLGNFAAQALKIEKTINPKFIGSLLLSENLVVNSEIVSKETINLQNSLKQEKIDCPEFDATYRYQWINKICRASSEIIDTRSKRRREILDSIATHKVFGPIIFFMLMAVMFQSIFSWSSVPMEIIDQGISGLGAFVSSLLPDGTIQSLLVDGVIAGVGSVVIFIPQIAILFAFLSLLEESGYLTRAAFLMDRLMRPFGLQGRSFIPLLSCFACAVPGIMSTRSIPSVSDRLITILVSPLMSCSARLPVYTVLIAAVIPNTYIFGFISIQAASMFGLYLLGIITAALVGLTLRLTLMRGSPSLFVMEMPPYRSPNIKNIFRSVFERVRLFLSSAGSTILICSLVLWFLAYFPRGDIKDSFAGMFGRLIEPLIAPLGFNWELGIAILASFAAREVFVSSLSTVFSLQATDDSSTSLIQELSNRTADGTFSLASGISLLVFFAFACQCMSTLAVTKRETGSWKWPIIMFTYLTALAYISSLIVYNVMK